MRAVHFVWITWAICLLLGGLILAVYLFNDARRREEHELRKVFVEKCQMTPKQAEKLIPETP